MSEMREITAALAEEIAYDCCDRDDWRIVSDEIVGQTRWLTQHRKVVHDIHENTYWELLYATGSTELQEGSERIPTVLYRVYPYVVVRTEYSRTG